MRLEIFARGLVVVAVVAVINVIFINIKSGSMTMTVSVESDRIENDVAPKIALTFDDGPSDMEGGTDYLLDGLAKRGVVATFFVLGSRAAVNPLIMTRMYEEGHLIGNHTYNHVELDTISLEEMLLELECTNEIIESITGEQVLFMRPPFGAWERTLEEYVDMMPVFWTIDSLDWTTNNIEEIVNNVVTVAQENDIILMHDCYASSAEAAFLIIDILQERGFEFVTVDEILLE